MKLTIAQLITLSLLATASAAPITPSNSPPRALGDGTFNVVRLVHGLGEANLELVNESSHFGVGKRMIRPAHDPAHRANVH